MIIKEELNVCIDLTVSIVKGLREKDEVMAAFALGKLVEKLKQMTDIL